ncbi:MAG: hypothetical protein Kow0063_35320 [Anaerolineae bacterium]
MSKNQIWLLLGGLSVLLICICAIMGGGAVAYVILSERMTEGRPELVEGDALPTMGLVAYYPLDGNANDESGNGNHGKEYGGLEYVEGRVGQAAYFDGVDDYIEIIPQGSVSVFGDFTISAWTYLEDWKKQVSADIDRQYIFALMDTRIPGRLLRISLERGSV